MEKLGARADALARKYPNCVEALIWDGIVTSERASLTWGFSALKLATRARDILQKAYRMNPRALDAGAPTSLGVLYYRVPGFPIAWGNKKKARRLLSQAVRLAPQGRDAHYFYADFLYRQGEYRKAEKVLLAGLKTPDDPERPLWSRVFPRVMRGLLAKIRKPEGKS
jgi:tetratricopeptide (TPR) repeat protein